MLRPPVFTRHPAASGRGFPLAPRALAVIAASASSALICSPLLGRDGRLDGGCWPRLECTLLAAA